MTEVKKQALNKIRFYILILEKIIAKAILILYLVSITIVTDARCVGYLLNKIAEETS